jgi:hypothetical protein
MQQKISSFTIKYSPDEVYLQQVSFSAALKKEIPVWTLASDAVISVTFRLV